MKHYLLFTILTLTKQGGERLCLYTKLNSNEKLTTSPRRILCRRRNSKSRRARSCKYNTKESEAHSYSKSNHSNSKEAMSRPGAAKTSSAKPCKRTHKFSPAVQHNTMAAQTPHWDLLRLCIQCTPFDFAQMRLHITARRQYGGVAAEILLKAAEYRDYNRLFAPGLQSPKPRKQNLTPRQIQSAFSRQLRKNAIRPKKKIADNSRRGVTNIMKSRQLGKRYQAKQENR